jgi:uncharacterized protein YifE (UPF0438 family)
MLYVAELETRNFHFLAVAKTEERARAEMRRAWKRHMRQTGAAMTWPEVSGDVNVRALPAGRVLRDGQVF